MPYWLAWKHLQRSRPLMLGYGVAVEGEIPYGEISRYAHDHGMGDPETLEELLIVFSELDGIYLSHMAEKRKQALRNK